MKKRNTKQVILPLITSFIWGSSFVAQSLGAGKVGGFTFTAARSIPAVLVLGALVLILRRVRHAKVQIEDTIFWLLFSAALLILAVVHRVRAKKKSSCIDSRGTGAAAQ